MDVPRSVFIERHGLKEDVLAAGLGLVYINEFEEALPLFENVRVALLAYFTFKFLPVVRCDVLTVLLDVTLRLDPVLEALKVDESYTAAALAGEDERVLLWLLFRAPAEPALYCLLSIPISGDKIKTSCYAKQRKDESKRQAHLICKKKPINAENSIFTNHCKDVEVSFLILPALRLVRPAKERMRRLG